MSIYLTDAHTGWTCGKGASLISEATSPGPGTLPRLHGVIYACEHHREAAEGRISEAGCSPITHDAPPSHRWNPWPCGHVTAYDEQVASHLGAAPVVDPPTVIH